MQSLLLSARVNGLKSIRRKTQPRAARFLYTRKRNMSAIPLLNQLDAQQLDVELMREPGFSIDQLMELAGLSVACAVAAVFSPPSRILAVAGPGNNGGDALVAARHLIHFGYIVDILYPKRPNKQLFFNLVAQCENLNVPFIDSIPENADEKYDVILDGIFGFSFNAKGGIRPPFDKVLGDMTNCNVPIASIDVPSGWNVEDGPVSLEKSERLKPLNPFMLISLTAPKLCSKYFEGEHHYLGGRFLPPSLGDKYGLTGLPPYPGTSQCVKLPSICNEDSKGSL